MSSTMEILLRKLCSGKFDNRLLKWMQSYLSDRKLKKNKQKKKKKKNTFFNAGRKIRSPTRLYIRSRLFLIFIIDIPLFINEAYAEVYANDATVYAANKDTIVVEYKLQNGAIGFWTWCRNNKMFNHFIKTSVMTIGTRYHTSRTDPMSIIIDNEQIQNVESQKLLGVSIDRTLSWDKQIDFVF